MAGSLKPRQLKSAIIGMVPISICINLFGPLGIAGGGLSLFAIAWAVAYNLYFKFNLLSPLPYAVAFSALPTSIAFSKSELPPLWMWLGGATFGMAAHFINVIKDMEEDRVSKIGGLPQKLGTRKSFAVALVLIVSGLYLIFR